MQNRPSGYIHEVFHSLERAQNKKSKEDFKETPSYPRRHQDIDFHRLRSLLTPTPKSMFNGAVNGVARLAAITRTNYGLTDTDSIVLLLPRRRRNKSVTDI